MARFVMDYPWRVEWNPTSVIEQLNYRAGIGTYENIRANAFPGTPFGEDYFQNPHLYFYADGDFLRCLRVGVSIRMIPNITASAESIQKLIAAYPGISDQNVWTILSPIYNYLRQLRYTPYYKALVEFKWRAGLLQFPLFDQFGMVAVSDGRLVGVLLRGINTSGDF